ncbi:type IV secretory system conjugative DNA transfer family protein [Vibrio parahaemolyticus]|uniref:type IV secretory system conjugative DNA transfer family protein n=1 Tax=Vibrio parahaemolyticus TaxID=670 RepID=UPI0008139C9F|nr:type IV secretory system conjugative DNA transfer family protein [Vibrio parahaemolyticus]OCP68298.1 hypothetical protein AKH08_15900 [Vibrio parahaemolyticus]
MVKSLLRSLMFNKSTLLAVCVGSVAVTAPAVAKPNAGIYDYFYEIEQSSYRPDSNFVSDHQLLNGGDLLTRGRDVEAQSIGNQAGKYWAQQAIKEMLHGQERKLDNVFDIAPYVQTYGQYYVLPPVITESRGAKTYKDVKHQSFSVADRAFFIRSEPRFIDTIPTWRDYVRFTAKKPQITTAGLLPSTDEEKEAWKKNFDIGWKDGVKAAVLTLDLQFAKLTHEKQGFERYIILRDAGYVTEPQFQKSSQPVTGNKNMMMIGNEYVSIRVQPSLDHNYKNWRIIPQLPVLEDLLPIRYHQLLQYGSGL